MYFRYFVYYILKIFLSFTNTQFKEYTLLAVSRQVAGSAWSNCIISFIHNKWKFD